MAWAWRIVVDVGGTFTDLAAVDDAGDAVRLGKVPTTPADQSVGVAAGLTALERGRVEDWRGTVRLALAVSAVSSFVPV